MTEREQAGTGAAGLPPLLAETFYEETGEGTFASSAATGGPWDARMQHAGPPSALIARAFEALEPDPALRIARMTVEVLGPVPVTELHVRAQVLRPGKRIQLLEGVVEAGGRELLRARAWRLRTQAGAAPALPEAASAPELPGEQPPPQWPAAHMDGYMAAVEWRFADGEFATPGPGRAWARPRIELVAGEPTSPLCRLLILADSGSGVGAAVDPAEYAFMNTDLTVALHRHPDGEWICLESRTTIDPDGVGLAETVLSDATGRLGRGLQTLTVSPRGG